MKRIIDIDLDGVVADFVIGYETLYNVSIDNVEMLTLNKTKFAKDDFFRNLPVIKSGLKLLRYLDTLDNIEIRILTAVGDNDLEINKLNKELWVKENLGNYKFLWVKKAVEKAKYATKDSYLVDDRAKSLNPYLDAGGSGYLYNDDCESAISSIDEWLNNES